MKKHPFYLALGVMAACSSSPSGDDGGVDASNDVTTGQDAANDVTQSNDAASDVQTSDVITDAQAQDAQKKDAATDAGDGGATLYTLTIDDYLNWCNVSINGGTATSNPQPVQFGPDASVSLHGDTANASVFYWGYWQAPGLGDGGKITNMDVTLNMTGDVTVLACCPDLNTPLSCP